MVRVISVHHFSKQDVTSCTPPAAAVIANLGNGENKLVIATQNQVLEVRDLREPGKVSHSFQTIDRVSELLYSPSGRCLVTLEGEKGQRGSSVRAYTNWHDPAVDNAPIRPRIASRTTPSEQGEAVTLDMVEFPQRDSPLQIALCPSTGNLLVGAVNLLIIYKQTVRSHEVTKAKFVDFQECFHIFHTFVPRELTLCEDVIGCLSEREVHVFKVKVTEACSQEERSLRSISLYSFTSDSENSNGAGGSLLLDPFTGLPLQRRNSSEEEEVASPPTVSSSTTSFASKFIPKVIKNITLRRQQDSESNETTHLDGYSGNIKRHPNHVTLGGSDPNQTVVHLPEIEEGSPSMGDEGINGVPKIMAQTLGPTSPPVYRNTAIKCLMSSGDFETECVVLVHCKLTPEEEARDMFKNLRLQPVYWREFRVKKTTSTSTTAIAHPLHSASHPHLMSLTMCFTSQNEGYLYHLPGHLRKTGKGCGVQRVATYPFTSPVGRTALEPTLMHALTETGLETYTLRSGYHTVLEAESLNLRTNACPGDGDNPICLVGLRPFLGAKHLMVSGSHLVILSSAEDAQQKKPQEDKWTVYSLTLPSPIDLHKDMTALADMNRTISPQGYYQLLCEAHMVLRTSLHQLIWEKKAVTGDEALKETLEKYQDTCLELALYHVLCSEEKEWRLALPYFRMSGKPVPQVLRASREAWEKSTKHDKKTLPAGLLHYVQEVILKPTAAENKLDATLADEIIDLLGCFSLSTLSLLVLKSPTFKMFKINKMHDYFLKGLKDVSLPEPAEVLAFALLSVDKGVTEDAAALLKRPMAPFGVRFSALLIEYHPFLLELSDSGDSFSEFAMLLRDCMPDLFVEVLVSLIKGGVFSLSTILQLFIGSFVSMSNITGEAAHNAAMLQLFLETYFTELLSEEEDERDLVLDQEQEQALQTLVRSYLSSLTVPVRFGDKDIDTDMFGTRHTYLDKLPPFEGQNSAKDALEEADSPDFWCQNTLLKLQSLLCSKSLGLPCCHGTINAFLEMYPDVTGALSLRVLASTPSQSIPLLCHAHPAVLLPYACETTPRLSQDHWRHMLTCLHEQLTGSAEDLSDRHEAWYSAMQEVLDHLAQTLSLDAFLEVLPSHDPHAEDFQGYIQMCRKNQQAADIQNLIVATGHKLLSSLTL